MLGDMLDSSRSTQGNILLLDSAIHLLELLICLKKCLSLIQAGVLPLSATPTWHLFMISMRSLFVSGLSVLTLSSHLLLKKYIKEFIWRESVNFNPDPTH